MDSEIEKSETEKWNEDMWDKANSAQVDEITAKYGKEVAEEANYGWGDATSDTRIDIATKVYAKSGWKVLSTTADFPETELQHTWRKY